MSTPLQSQPEPPAESLDEVLGRVILRLAMILWRSQQQAPAQNPEEKG